MDQDNLNSCVSAQSQNSRTRGGEPVIPLPDVGEGGPVYPGGTDNTPVIPLPSPGEGGPVYPGNSGATSPIRPNPSRVRFLNGAYGYPALRVFLNSRRFVDVLNYASATRYSQVSAGYHTVTIANTSGYIYLQKTMPFPAGAMTTIAIIKTAGGMDLLQIPDSCCPPGGGYSSFRVGNLAYNTGPLDVLMSDGRVVYGDLRFKETGAFKRIMPGRYQFFFADTNLLPMPAFADIETLDSAWLGVCPPQETFGSLYLNAASGAIYSVYLLQSGTGRNQIQSLVLMDR